MPGRVAMGCNFAAPFRAVGLCRPDDNGRDSVPSVLSAPMSDRQRMHAPNRTRRRRRDSSPGMCRAGVGENRTPERARVSDRAQEVIGSADSKSATDVGRWRFELHPDERGPLDERVRSDLIGRAMAAIRGECGPPLRRSRHAATFMERMPGASGPAAVVYFKVYDRPHGLDRVRRMITGSRARGAMAGTLEASRRGIRAPAILLIGEERSGGRAILATRKVDGRVLPRFLARCDLTTRRQSIRQLGREIARFHAAGLIHGDLTPFNIFVTREEPPGFVFIDHERTRGVGRFNRTRRRLRNLVQLGRFELDFISRIDRMRLYTAWTSELAKLEGNEHKTARRLVRHQAARRLIKMVRNRIGADRGLVHVATDGQVTIRRVEAT